MFLEYTGLQEEQRGWIEVICGSMFSGKTEELLRRVKRAEIAQQKFQLFKPKVDTRYDDEKVVSHDGKGTVSQPVAKAQDILNLVDNNTKVVAIDEAQFFDKLLPDVCTVLARKGKRVMIAGLDMDYLGKPFGPMPELLAIAEYVTKVHAICVQCGHLAYVSHRTAEDDERVLLGELDAYQPLCRRCFDKQQMKGEE